MKKLVKKAGKGLVSAAKKGAENYKAPTPKKWVKIGDAIQDIGFIVGAATVFTASPIVPFLAVVLGKAGKIITNFSK